MAQWRPLHRRITSSDKVVQLANDPFSLWLYCALLPHTDADGRINGNPVGLAGTIFEGFGYTPERIQAGLTALAQVGLIILYRNGRNQHLVQYTKFQEMCRPDKREARSEYPGPTDEGSELTTGTLPEALPGDFADTSGKIPEALPEDSAKNPRLHVHVHEQLHEQTRAHARAERSQEKPKKPRNQKPPPEPGYDATRTPLPDFISPDVWESFVTFRAELGRPLTEEGTKETLKDLAKHPLDADEMLRTSIKRTWTGVFPLDKARDGPTGQNNPAAEAWEQILAGARQGTLPHLEPRAKQALTAIGGWTTVAYGDERGLGILRKRYLDAYRENAALLEGTP